MNTVSALSPAAMAALLVGAGLALVVTGVLTRGRRRDLDLAALLDLPYGEHDVPVTAVTERPVVRLAGLVVKRVDDEGALRRSLDAARLPFTPAEYVAGVSAIALVAAAVSAVLTSHWLFSAIGAMGAAYAGIVVPRLRATKVRRRIEEQLPDALSMVAASLEAGHTFLRSIQMLCEEVEPPISQELQRVVREAALGDSLVDALQRMADRLRIQDLDWAVQAIRIQHDVGGKLSDLLHTIAEFIRAREEVRREVRVLTAEGRMSAWVLGAMPVVMVIAMQTLNPGYLAPMLGGWGLAVLGAAAASTAMGVVLIARMVRIEV